MNPKVLHNLTMVPFLIIGLMASILGVAWLTTSEPWMLDKSANVIPSNQLLSIFVEIK